MPCSAFRDLEHMFWMQRLYRFEETAFELGTRRVHTLLQCGVASKSCDKRREMVEVLHDHFKVRVSTTSKILERSPSFRLETKSCSAL